MEDRLSRVEEKLSKIPVIEFKEIVDTDGAVAFDSPVGTTQFVAYAKGIRL